MKNLSLWLYDNSKMLSFWLFLVGFLLFEVAIFPFIGASLAEFGVKTIPDLMIQGYSPVSLYAELAGWSAEGLKKYRLVELTADVAFPLVNACFFCTTITLLLRRQGQQFRPLGRLNLLPFLMLLADFAENACFVTIVSNYPQRLDATAQLAAVFSAVKWGSALAILVVVISLLLWRLIRPHRAVA